jgi:hypothetical protein
MSKITSIGTLVALAAKMSDSADELQVIQFLSVETRWFPGSLKNYQTMLNHTMSYCSADDAASAKSQEILHAWDEAALLVQLIVKKIGAP